MTTTLKVLVVEDEPTNAEILNIMLSREGYEVFTAPSGPVGLQLAQTHAPDIIFMDLLMPGEFDGMEAIRRLRQQLGYRGLIICQSAWASSKDQQAAMAAGADGYLTKPFKRQDVLDMIQAHLDRLNSR